MKDHKAMHKNLFFVANWKMNKPYHESLRYAEQLCASLEVHNSTVIVCPSLVALADCGKIIHQSRIKLGAQNCSEHESGAYTGQTDAQSLEQLGCSFGIVGHSEQRTLTHETDQTVAQKAARLITHGITPIMCIGEEFKQEQGWVEDFLEKQLGAFALESRIRQHDGELMLAYEPRWTIAKGTLPSTEFISTIVQYIHRRSKVLFPDASIHILYGGSADEENAAELLSIEHLDGLLIGSSSLDFQKFQNIVSLRKKAL
jgi:triosephosphate isomerase